MKRKYALYDNWTVEFDQPSPRDHVRIIKEKMNTGEKKDVYIPRSALLKWAIAELEPELGALVCRQLISRLIHL